MPVSRAADPVDEALRLVPPSTTIAVVVRDLRTRGETIADSPFVGWLKESPVFAQFGDPKDLQKFQELERFVADQLGATPRELVSDVLGDAIVFAYQPGPPGKPDLETGVILIRPRKPDVMTRVIDKLNALQKLTGEIVSVQEKSYRDRSFYIREKKTGGHEFYFLRNGTFAFSGSERGIEQVIDQEDTAPATADRPSPLATSLRSLGVADRMMVFWINPRGFDAELKSKQDASKNTSESAFLAQFRNLWSATRGIAVYAHPDTGLALGCVVSIESGRLPQEIRDLVTVDPTPSSLWKAVPENAIFAAAGRISVSGVLRGIATFLPVEGQDGLKSTLEEGLAPLVGRERFPRFMETIGPDWAVWITPSAAGANTWLPEWTVAVKLPPDPDLVRSTLQIVDFGAHLMRIDYNRKHDDQIDLIEDLKNGLSVKVLSNDRGFPPGFRPSYAVVEGHLVFAGNPDQVRRFRPVVSGRSRQKPPSVYLSTASLLQYLDANHEKLVDAAASNGEKSRPTVDRELRQFEQFLGAFRTVEIHHSANDHTFRIDLQIELVKPLK
jgi:hypothetical protein